MLINLALVPLMFMRASPVHTYLLDEVFADMTGIKIGNVTKNCWPIKIDAPSSGPSLAAEREDSVADPLKTPTTIKPISAAGAEFAVFLFWSAPSQWQLSSSLQILTPAQRIERPPDAAATAYSLPLLN
jgi:hypothetical protein